jgi:hypothetical protein
MVNFHEALFKLHVMKHYEMIEQLMELKVDIEQLRNWLIQHITQLD